MKIFLKKNDFTIGLAVILIFGSYVFLPFFIYTPLVQISMDTFDYSYLAKLIFDGNIPCKELILDLPIGYPVIIYFVKALNLSFNHLVVSQLIFYIISFIFLCFQLSTFKKFGGLIVAISFIFYSLNSYTIKHVFQINPESIYASCLIFLVGGLFYYFRKKNKISLIVIFFSIAGAILLRSNGVYLYFIIIIIIWAEFQKKKQLKSFFLIFLTFLLFISSLNYTVKGFFAPFDKNRVIKVISSPSFGINSIENHSLKELTNPTPQRYVIFVNYFKSFSERHSSYYYSMQKTNYERIIKNKTFTNLDQRFFDGKVSVRNSDIKLLPFMFQEKNDYAFIEKSIYFKNGKNNIWLYSIYIIQELFYFFKINIICYVLFWISLFYYSYFSFKERKIEWRLLIFYLYLFSLFFLPFIHRGFNYRYLHVSEFVIYILVLGFIISLKDKKLKIVK